MNSQKLVDVDTRRPLLKKDGENSICSPNVWKEEETIFDYKSSSKRKTTKEDIGKVLDRVVGGEILSSRILDLY